MFNDFSNFDSIIIYFLSVKVCNPIYFFNYLVLFKLLWVQNFLYFKLFLGPKCMNILLIGISYHCALIKNILKKILLYDCREYITGVCVKKIVFNFKVSKHKINLLIFKHFHRLYLF